MSNRRNCFLWTCLTMGLILGSVNSVFAEENANQTTEGELYEKAMELKEKGDYEAALGIFNKIASEGSKDQIQDINALIEQSMILKDANKPEWKVKAKEAAYRIKVRFVEKYQNPDYWLVWAKYSALVRKKRHVKKAFKKTFAIKPNYAEGYIVKGDIYAYMAKGDKVKEAKKIKLAKIAKEAYEFVTVNPTISNTRRAYIYYRLGELEKLVFSNKQEAVRNWKKAVEIAPESTYGKKSAELLKSNQ